MPTSPAINAAGPGPIAGKQSDGDARAFEKIDDAFRCRPNLVAQINDADRLPPAHPYFRFISGGEDRQRDAAIMY